jgi:drug/metabolite transporter (DMT)-like permease
MNQSKTKQFAHTARGSRVAPHLALLLVQVMFATWPIAGKIALRTIPSTGLVAFRVAGGALTFVLLQTASRRSWTISRRDWPLLALCGLLGVAFNQLLFVKGLSLTTVINCIVLSTTIPVFTLLVSIVIRQDRATPKRIAGMLIAAAGVICLLNPSLADFSRVTRKGDILIVANSLCYGAYIATSKKLVARYNALSIIAWLFIISCFVAVPIGAVSLVQVSLSGVGLRVCFEVLYIILVPTVGAYYLSAWALARVPPSTVAVYTYIQPLIVFALAPLLLGEKLTLRTLVATLLICAGVAVVTRRSRSRTIQEASEHPEALSQ